MGAKKRTTKCNYARKQTGEEGSSKYQNRLEKRAKNLEVTECLWYFVQVSDDYRGIHLPRTLTCSAKVFLGHTENPFK